MSKNTIIRDAIILFVITLIAGLLLGAVHEITLDPIAKAKADSAAKTYKQIMPDAVNFEGTDELSEAVRACSKDPAIQEFGRNVTVDDALYAKDASGTVIGYIVISSSKGYGGQVQTAAGITNDGTITGLGYLNINETPGLGMKAKEPFFTDQFRGMTDVSRMQAISGATSTSKAVRGAVMAAKYFFENYTEGGR